MRHRPSAAVRLPALLVLFALLAAACGGDDDSTTGTPADPGAGDGTETEVEGEVDPDGSFVYAYPIGVSRLDPHLASISQDGTTLFPAYDRLVHLAPDGELIPGLAESWEFSEDGMTLTMNLREGVTFHDGAEFNAEAAKMNLDRAETLEGSSVTTDIASVSEVTVVDEYTIELTLSEPNVSIIGGLADRAGIQVSPQALEGGVNLDEEMVGAGPYRFVSHTPGSSTTFERFEEYWGEPAQVRSFEIRVLADAVARLNAFRQGEIDATTLSANQVAEVEGDERVNLLLNTELQYFYIVQNRARANQDDVRVRQAMVHALDRQGICDSILFGYCELTDQPFPPGYFAYDDEIDDVLYDYDPERARELLAEAGIESLDVSFLIPAGLPTYPEMSEAIQAQWAEVGINAEIQAAEPTQLGQLMFAEQSADTMLATWGGRPDPSITFAQRGSSTGFANPGGVTTPEMEELFQASRAEPDVDARQEILRQGSREMAESVLELVLMFPQVPYVLQDDVVGFEPYLTSKPEFRTVGVTG